MASRIRKAISLLALVVMASLGAGCGSSGADGSQRAVEWAIDRVISPKSIRLTATAEVCWKPVQLEQPIIEYEEDRVYIELRHTPEEKEGEWSGCLLSLSTLDRAVIFERDLDQLILFDASTDPPEQRWPTKTPLPTE
jgi:hypothetical protein